MSTQGDPIGVPDGTRHWFDMGSAPSFIAVGAVHHAAELAHVEEEHVAAAAAR